MMVGRPPNQKKQNQSNSYINYYLHINHFHKRLNT